MPRLGAGSTPDPAHGEEALAAADLDHEPDLDVGHRRGAAGARAPVGGRGDRDAGRLEAGHRRAGAVDRVDDEDPLGLGGPRRVRRDDQAAVLGVEGDARGRARPGSASIRASACSSIAKVTSPPAPGSSACSRPSRRPSAGRTSSRTTVAEASDEVGERVLHASGPPRPRGSSGRASRVTSIVSRSPSRITSSSTWSPGLRLRDQPRRGRSPTRAFSPLTATITSPPTSISWPWNSIVSSPAPLIPASAAGPPSSRPDDQRAGRRRRRRGARRAAGRAGSC